MPRAAILRTQVGPAYALRVGPAYALSSTWREDRKLHMERDLTNSDLTAELSGSLGLGASLNSGSDHAMGQAAHGSAPDIAGQNIANPFSLILSAGMLLGWYGQRKSVPAFIDAARAISDAVALAVEAGEATRDVGGKLGTKETGDAFVARLLTA